MNQRIVIEPNSSAGNYWKDLRTYRGLFYFLAWRDVLVRYKQTSIGILWSLLKPFFSILLLSFIGWFLKADPHGVPYILLVSVGTLPWQLFSSILSDSGNSLITNSNLISKVYFPRIIIPASTVIVCLLDFFISLLILAGFMIYYHQPISLNILLFPVFVVLAVVASLGAGLFVAALNVKYRDFKFIIPFVLQIGYFASPLLFTTDQFYARTAIPQWVKFIYSLNPMVSVIDGMRWSLLGNALQIEWTSFLISIGISLLFLVSGIYYFRRTENEFADVI